MWSSFLTSITREIQLDIRHNISLKPLNTLQIDAKAKHLAIVDNENQLSELITSDTYKNLEKFILGRGSNLLVTKDYSGLVIKNEIMGRQVVSSTDSAIVVEYGAGEDWVELVDHAVSSGWGGAENLSLIPGTAGAAPVQNIAAYGQNLVDIFQSLEAVDLESGEKRTFQKDECGFGYRQSVFKNEYKGRYCITKVRLKFALNPSLETGYYSIGGRYDSLQGELESITKPPYSIADVSRAVKQIRQRKLPDWKTTPTVGSYFINPTIDQKHYQRLKKAIPELQAYPAEQLRYDSDDHSDLELVKVPAGRLLDHLGWGGRTMGNCMTYNGWASIVTHNGRATGQEVLSFVQTMAEEVQNSFGVKLESEVALI